MVLLVVLVALVVVDIVGNETGLFVVVEGLFASSQHKVKSNFSNPQGDSVGKQQNSYLILVFTIFPAEAKLSLFFLQ